MADKKPISIFGALIIAVIALGGFYLWSSSQGTAEAPAVDLAEEEVSSDPAVEINVEAALKDRILGDPNAPIKMSEHSSFTCGHCAAFHKSTFGAFKKAFVDTGKVYIVFSDFPLNAPALHASMAARCLPDDKYFDFVEMLFETQEKWAFERNYINILQDSAAEYGLNKAKFKACVSNEKLQEGIVARQRAAQTQWKINSTPSFVLNNTTTVSGGQPLEHFKKIIDEELAKAEGSTP